MKRVRKAKADGVDTVTITEDSPSMEQIAGAHSMLEISGPTIPSPGPSGTLRAVIVISSSLLSSVYSNHHEGRKKMRVQRVD